MVVKVYVSGISGNKEVKKRQQRVLMILESKGIPFEVVDITEPGKEAEKDFMQTNSKSLGVVTGVTPRHPLPPQIFTDSEYCGDYEQFDLANEIDTLELFLKVEIQTENAANRVLKDEAVNNSVNENIEAILEKIETNGIVSSRETSVEAESKPVENTSTSNGVDNSDEGLGVDTEEKDEEAAKEEDIPSEEVVTVSEDVSKDLSPSEDLIKSERSAAD